ncbi:MAG: hypothetical protein IPP59_09355 [Betaproteobacteria bacterium]|nr:hypothetical protein [Candidatus Dechloromonas phosphorivorans]
MNDGFTYVGIGKRAATDHQLAKLTAALVAAGLLCPMSSPPPDTATLQRLVERNGKLEARNAELEKQVKSLKGEVEIAKVSTARAFPNTSRRLTVRLKAVEKDALEMKNPPRSRQV